MSLAAALRWVKRSSIWTSRAFAWTAIAGALACAAVVLSLRYWFLPNIERYRDDIAMAVSRAADLKITIGRISGDWDGMRPHLVLEDVSVYDKAGRRALDLTRVESTLAWRSLAALKPHFQSLDIYRPALEVRRDARGVMSVAGIELEIDERKGGGFTDWLLQQPDVEVHDAQVSWTDELRGAPRLELSQVKFQMINHYHRHRFGVRALPPPTLAGPIDVRADLRGDAAQVVSNWNGRLFVQLDSADLAGWGAWVDIPIELTHGAGGVRSWLTFSGNELAQVTADLRLSAVRSRLRKDLPELELDALAGRLGWKRLPAGYEFSTEKLALEGAGAKLAPADFLLRVDTDKHGTQHGELHANALDLAPLVMLADRLPLADDVRTQLIALSPRGRLHDLNAKWEGALPQPARYSARGRFENLAVNRTETLPGISGLSGNIDGSEKGGTLHLSGEHAALDMPAVFADALELDTLSGQLAWSRSGDAVDFHFNNVAFANADAAGTLSGSYRRVPQRRGDIDLTAGLSRADARAVHRYIPVNELKKLRPWLERAIVAGTSTDVRFRMKGRLDDFPFTTEKRGIFQIVAKVSGGTLDYADRWPRVENLDGELQFRNTRMEFTASQGTISGVKIGPVQGEIPDLTAKPDILDIRGEAEGATPDFLAFVAKSPVAEMTDHFTDNIQAQGTGRLALRLVLPLGAPNVKVAGTYVFSNNQVVFERDVPPFEQASGRIEFTENTVRVPGASGIFLGGPLAINAATQREGGVRAVLQGRINAENLRKAAGLSWLQHTRGTTDWRGVLTVRKKVPELVAETNMQGITTSLPAPFAKTASEIVPLRLERRIVNAQQDRVSFTYGDVVKAELARRTEGKQTVIERGIIRLGPGDAGEPDRPGIWVRGILKTFDFDDWLAFSRGGGAGGEGDSGYTIAGADVRLGDVDFFGRRFTDLSVNAWTQKDVTQLTLAGKELEGGVMWRSEGKGRLTARLKRLLLPASDGKPLAPSTKPPPGKPLELPALDVVVDQFQYGQKQLGKLELNAVHQERDWRIEKLRLSSPDFVLTADGVWQAWLTQPRTSLNLRMDVNDVGKTLTRWAFAPGVRNGTAKIEGQLSWAASPVDFDYPTLTGNLSLEAAKGQFVKLDPGIAKLLGILSLQSLPRRISLDFRDIFSEGFAFDSIAGALRIERGILNTDNFRIAGPSARVVMSGDVDLAQETQKLRVRVTPHLSEAAALAGALIGGPVAGVAALLAQKVLRDPIEQLVSFEYVVTGSWSDPQVAKAERAAALNKPDGAP